MGIPGLFSSLKDKYTNIITQKSFVNIPFTILLFDYNSLIHPISNLLLSKYTSITDNEHEILLIEESLKYTDDLINNIKPDICGIFIDGVCPMAKMVQQRQRRYASIIDKEYIKNIYSKYKEKQPREYNTNTISPGTEFMEKFHNNIIEYINNNNNNNKLQFVYSSYLDIGEGEHKIMSYIKRNKNFLVDKNILIYGLDADLIILSLTLINEYSIFLLRENQDNPMSSNIENMIIFNVKECAKSIILELSSNQETFVVEYLIDFIFISNILGNDFILPNPTVNIRFIQKINGVDTIIKCYKMLSLNYKKLHKNTIFMIEKKNKIFKINWEFFTEYIKLLSTNEISYFEKSIKRYVNNNNNTVISEINYYNNILLQNNNNPIDIENSLINYNTRKLRYIHYYFNNNVCMCSDGDSKIYESPLYKHDLNFTYSNKNLVLNNKNYNKIIRKYITTFLFVMYYYFEGCPDNLFYYPYYSSILLSDLYYYLINEDKIKLNKIGDNFIKKKYFPIYPLQQLVLILPYTNYNILPINILKNTSIFASYYKIKYLPSLDCIIRDKFNKSKLFQSLLIINTPTIYEINAFLIDVLFTYADIKRCLTISIF